MGCEDGQRRRDANRSGFQAPRPLKRQTFHRELQSRGSSTTKLGATTAGRLSVCVHDHESNSGEEEKRTHSALFALSQHAVQQIFTIYNKEQLGNKVVSHVHRQVQLALRATITQLFQVSPYVSCLRLCCCSSFISWARQALYSSWGGCIAEIRMLQCLQCPSGKKTKTQFSHQMVIRRGDSTVKH
jgi:hypothetical protein